MLPRLGQGTWNIRNLSSLTCWFPIFGDRAYMLTRAPKAPDAACADDKNGTGSHGLQIAYPSRWDASLVSGRAVGPGTASSPSGRPIVEVRAWEAPMKAQGWYRDPYLVHEDRYFSDGQPTKRVRD